MEFNADARLLPTEEDDRKVVISVAAECFEGGEVGKGTGTG